MDGTPVQSGSAADLTNTVSVGRKGGGAVLRRLAGLNTMDLYTGYIGPWFIVQELCESRGGRPGLSVLTSLLVSVDVKNY